MLERESRCIEVTIYKNKTSGLLVALGDDMRGLIVHARSFHQLADRILKTIRALLDAEGFKCGSLTVTSAAPGSNFIPCHMTYRADRTAS